MYQYIHGRKVRGYNRYTYDHNVRKKNQLQGALDFALQLAVISISASTMEVDVQLSVNLNPIPLDLVDPIALRPHFSVSLPHPRFPPAHLR